MSGGSQAQGYVDGGRGFADAALAAGDRDDGLDARQDIRRADFRHRSARSAHFTDAGSGRRRGVAGAFRRQHDRGRNHALEGVNDLFRQFAHGLQFGALRRVDLDRKGDMPVLGLQTLDHAGADDVLTGSRFGHFRKRI